MDLFVNDDTTIVSSDRILYTPSSFAKSALLYLQEVGTLKALKPHVSKHTDLDSFLFFVVNSGEGTVEYQGEKFNLTPGSCVFIDCRYPFAHETSATNLWSLSWCHFFGPTLPMIYEKYMERGGLFVFTPEDVQMFQQLLQHIQETANNNDYIRDMRINEELSSLLTLLMAESWHKKGKSRLNKKHSVLPVKEYLERNYSEKITLEQLSKTFYMSKNNLTRNFKEQFGTTITAYLQVVRITNAKRFLRTTDMTVEEIAIECGFGAFHYFSRVFKEIEGVAPSVYREQW